MQLSFIVLLLVSPMLPANPLTRNSDWYQQQSTVHLWAKSSTSRSHRFPAHALIAFTFNPNHYETQSLCYFF